VLSAVPGTRSVPDEASYHRHLAFSSPGIKAKFITEETSSPGEILYIEALVFETAPYCVFSFSSENEKKNRIEFSLELISDFSCAKMHLARANDESCD